MPFLVVPLLAFVLGFVGSVPLAGPVSVMVVSRAGVGRFVEARHVALGAALGEGLYAGIAFLGFAALVASHPSAVPVSKGVTAVVLLVVGVHFLRWQPKDAEKGKESHGRSAFFLGLTASLVNPTLLLTWGAVTTAIYAHEAEPMAPAIAAPFGVAAGAGIACWNLVLLALLRRYQKTFPKKAIVYFVRGMGLLLIAIAIYNAIQLLRRFG